MGFRCKTISRNTLSNANTTRPWQLYADLAQHLIGMARPLYVEEPLALHLDATVYTFDSTTKFKRRYSRPVDRVNTHVRCDQTAVLTVFY